MSNKKYLWLGLLAMVACSTRKTTVLVQPAQARPVAIEVEVYDPVTNFVWENVALRVVEAEVTGAGGIYPNAFPNDWFFTDQSGLVFLDSYSLAAAQVGFLQDAFGQAVLDPGESARVVLQLDALGFTSVFFEVFLSWDQPQIFVSVPFS